MTYFVVLATDAPDRDELRAAYLRQPDAHPVRVRIGGPTLSEDGARMNGTLLVVEADSLAAVHAFLADDPYVRAGLFATTIVRPWQWGLGHPDGDPPIQPGISL
jgi:uncharacterized protein YciI